MNSHFKTEILQYEANRRQFGWQFDSIQQKMTLKFFYSKADNLNGINI